MLLLITYDVNTTSPDGQKRVRHVSKCCQAYGQRVQNSVFECDVNAAQATILKKKLSDIIDKQKDSLRLYNLGNHYKSKIVHIGAKAGYDPEDALIL